MIRARALRMLLAAALVLAQSAAGSFAAQMAAEGAPCAVHAALAPTAHDHASGHHGHAADAADRAHHASHEDSGEEGSASPHFSLACCSACTAGLTAADIPLQAPGWQRRPLAVAVHGLEPGELPSTDPPPRILL